MYTPQRKQSSVGITLTPRTEQRKVTPAVGKGKAVAFIDGPMAPPPPPPPVMSLGGTVATEDFETEDMNDWRRFKEAGLLDEAVMERKHRKALTEKASRLEKELFDYQYNMGLLLIEKKDWNAKFEELRQAFEEAKEILKREQSSNIIAFSEAQNREENLRNALSLEKQCVSDLEKALRDLQKERVEIKLSSESKLADAKALSVGMKEKSQELEDNLCTVVAKLSEINKKNSELDIKLQEIEARENMLQRDQLSLNTEKEAHQAAFYKQREDLLEWEKKLKKGEEKISELQRTLKQREEKANEIDSTHEQKRRDLEEAEKKINISSEKLREREDDINNCLLRLADKEKKDDSTRSSLEIKERMLLELEGKLDARAKMEVQNLVEEHRAALGAKTQELELELQERRKNLDEELRNKVKALEQHEVEVLHGEEKLRKREQALDKKSERVKEKEKELDVKLKSTKEKEKSMKADQKKLDLEAKKLLSERAILQNLKDECEKIRAEISEQELQIGEKSKNLKVTNEERLEHLRLQAELKQELEKCRHQEEFLLREGEDLKEQREKFEKELEVLEGKKAQLNKELNEITREGEKFKKLQRTAEERLKKEEHAMKEYSQREMETVRMEKESFEERKRNEQLVISENAKTEHIQMVQDFESQRSIFEADLISRREEMEKSLREREKAFQLLRQRELKEINNLKEAAQTELDEIQSLRRIIEKEKQEVAENKGKLDAQQFGMKNDIDDLVLLSNKLRAQREQVLQERNHFLAFVEKHKACKNCQDVTGEFILSGLLPPDVEDKDILRLQGKADELTVAQKAPDGVDVKISSTKLDSNFQERTSWLQKCTSKIFSISPKKIEHTSAPVLTEENTDASGAHANKASGSGAPGDKLQPTVGTINHSIGIQQVQFEENKLEGDGYSLSVDDYSNVDSKVEDSGQPELKSTRRKPGRKPGRGCKAGLSRTRSVKAVVEDAKLFLGRSSKELEDISDESHGISSHAEKTASKIARKRQRAPAESEQNDGDSEGLSDSVTTGGRRKRRQTATSVPTPGQNRYNLRRHKKAGAPTNQALSDSGKTEEKETDGGDGAEPIQYPETAAAQSLEVSGETNKSTDLVKVTTRKHVEFLEDRVVRLNNENVGDRTDATKSVEVTELSGEVNEASAYEDKDESGSTINEDDEEEYDDDDDDDDGGESLHPGEVSIGKKIWTFFTT